MGSHYDQNYLSDVESEMSDIDETQPSNQDYLLSDSDYDDFKNNNTDPLFNDFLAFLCAEQIRNRNDRPLDRDYADFLKDCQCELFLSAPSSYIAMTTHHS